MNSSFMKNLLSPQPQTGQQVVDQNVANGIQQGQNEHQVVQQMQQQAHDQEVAKQAQQQTLSQMAANALYQDQLLGYKRNYANAEQAGDQAGMDNARQQAAFFRDLLTKDGYDVNGFGADDTLAQAQTRSDYNKAKMMNTALSDTMTSGAYWDKQYNDYRQQGLNDKSARYYADEDAKNYQNSQLKDLRSMLFTVGIGPRGNLTPQGVEIMDMMYGERPESIGYLAQAVPSLVAEYAYQTGQEGKNLDLARQLGLLGAQNSFGLQNLAAKTQAQAYLDDNRTRNDVEKAAATAQYRTGGSGGASQSKSQSQSSNGGSTSTGSKERYSYLKDWIKEYEDKHKDDEDKSWQDNVDYQNRLEEFNSYSATKYDPTSYKSMLSMVTDMLASHEYTRDEIENTMRNNTDMADNILDNIDWQAWGY